MITIICGLEDNKYVPILNIGGTMIVFDSLEDAQEYAENDDTCLNNDVYYLDLETFEVNHLN